MSDRTLVQLVVVGVCASLFMGCGSTPKDPFKDDTPTYGKAVIVADVDARDVIAELEDLYSQFYPKTELDMRYVGETQLLHTPINDSLRCFVTSRALSSEQRSYLNRREISIRTVPIYIDGIAVVVNNSRRLDGLDLTSLAALLRNDDPSGWAWRSVADATDTDTVIPLFPGSGSGLARMLIDTLGISGIRGQALEDVQGVVDQVARDRRTIGFIPFSSISDLDDPAKRALRDRVTIVPISHSQGSPAIFPSQSTLADRQYPLSRPFSLVLVEGKSGLGTGFVSFAANIKGQRIILKLGVAPVRVPPRNLEIVHE